MDAGSIPAASTIRAVPCPGLLEKRRPLTQSVNCVDLPHAIDEAAELFRSGVDYLEIFDTAHSVDEDRFHTERDDDIFRFVGARMATKNERRADRPGLRSGDPAEAA